MTRINQYYWIDTDAIKKYDDNADGKLSKDELIDFCLKLAQSIHDCSTRRNKTPSNTGHVDKD